jgi:hypothetical protein
MALLFYGAKQELCQDRLSRVSKPDWQTITPDKRFLLQSNRGQFMSKFQGIISIASELRVERTSLINQLKHVDAALSVLGKLNGGSSFTEPRRTLAAVARKKMSRAQKARRAKQNGGTTGEARPKRTLSIAARRKIAAAQRARWAKFRAEKKAA